MTRSVQERAADRPRPSRQGRTRRWQALALLATTLGLTTACGLNHVPPPLLPPPPGLGPLRVSGTELHFRPTKLGKYTDPQPLIVDYDPPSRQPSFIPKFQPNSAFTLREYCKDKPAPHCKLDVIFNPKAAGAADEELTLQQPWTDRPDRPALHVHLTGMGLASR